MLWPLASAQLNGQQIVMLEQSTRLQTSITKVIEALPSQVLKNDLRGTEPSTVGLFKYDPAHLRPLVSWQEVTFHGVDPINKKTAWRGKISAPSRCKANPGNVEYGQTQVVARIRKDESPSSKHAALTKTCNFRREVRDGAF